ncbi:MAG: hypothetical protein ACM3XM_17110 [Mycobacterium leprae]
MKRMLATLFTIAILLTGCTAKTPSPSLPTPAPVTTEAPPPATDAPAPPASVPQTVTPAPKGADSLQAGPWCDTKRPAAERQQALVAALPAMLGTKRADQIAAEAQTGPTSCVQLKAVPGYEALLLTNGSAPGLTAVLAYKLKGQWVTAAIAPPGEDWAWIESLQVGLLSFPNAQPDLVLVGKLGASKSLFRATAEPSGLLRARGVSPSFWYAGIEMLTADWALVTERPPKPGDVIWDCNACMPMEQQWLLNWSSDKYVTVGTRTVSTPNYTANHLLGAIKAGDLQKAQTYAADPSVVPALRTLLNGKAPAPNSNDAKIRTIEEHNWDLLPAQFRQALPPNLTTYKLVLEGWANLEMRRDQQGWVVTAVTH